MTADGGHCIFLCRIWYLYVLLTGGEIDASRLWGLVVGGGFRKESPFFFFFSVRWPGLTHPLPLAGSVKCMLSQRDSTVLSSLLWVVHIWKTLELHPISFIQSMVCSFLSVRIDVYHSARCVHALYALYATGIVASIISLCSEAPSSFEAKALQGILLILQSLPKNDFCWEKKTDA